MRAPSPHSPRSAPREQPVRPEPYLTPKELAWQAGELGVSVSVDYVRAVLKQMPPLEAPRGRMARWSDWWTFYCMNPDLMPFSRDPAKRAVGKTRGLGEEGR